MTDVVPTLITAALRRRIADESRPYADRLEDLARLTALLGAWNDKVEADIARHRALTLTGKSW